MILYAPALKDMPGDTKKAMMVGMTKDIKARLDFWAKRTNTPEFAAGDPVQFPRRYSRAADAEAACFLVSVIAWGRREMILRSAQRMLGAMGGSPYDYIMSGGWKKLCAGKNAGGGRVCVHRTFFEDDLAYLCRGLRACLRKYGSLEKLFADAGDIFTGIALFRKTLARGNAGLYTKHVADPDKNSACKRINLALRWLVRRDGIVDLGLWKTISPARLYIPLDVHVARNARRLGLLERGSNDRKAVEILTARLREFCPEDPVKYDFALFGMGAEG
jgi:uncharacterized protein (TIGR02757 family)